MRPAKWNELGKSRRWPHHLGHRNALGARLGAPDAENGGKGRKWREGGEMAGRRGRVTALSGDVDPSLSAKSLNREW